MKTGFSKICINPPYGTPIVGYYEKRFTKGIADSLYVRATAFDDGEKLALVIAIDICHLAQNYYDEIKSVIKDATGIENDAIFINCSHTHTGPLIGKNFASGEDGSAVYEEFFVSCVRDAAVYAVNDLKDSTIETAQAQAKNISFIRRYRMKDGTIKTNPGVNNPDIVAPIGDIDERVNVLRFDREGADTIVLANLGCHPDVVGGSKISGDWPAMMRRTLEKTIDNTKCIFFNGAEGDVNHVNVHPRGGYLNGMFHDFDDVSRGYDHAKYMARVVTGGVLQAFDKVKYVDVENISCIRRTINVASNMPTAEELVEAEKIHALHEAGKDAELPYSGLMLTTKVAEAGRMVKLQNGPEAFPMELSSVAIGPVALIGLPGEPFTGIGRGLKEAEGWELVLPCCLTNGNEGYFPMQDAYDEGGYESQSSFFKAGVAEYLIEEGLKVLNDLRK